MFPDHGFVAITLSQSRCVTSVCPIQQPTDNVTLT
jgi:hypothetical protein